MKKIKKFLDERSKLALLVFLVSIVIGILLVIELTNYSYYVHLISTTDSMGVFQPYIINEFNVLVCSLLIFVCLFNLVGYLYKKSEFMFISTGLCIVLFCMSISLFNLLTVIFVACLLVLNLLGYIDQVKLIDKKKKKA